MIINKRLKTNKYRLNYLLLKQINNQTNKQTNKPNNQSIKLL